MYTRAIGRHTDATRLTQGHRRRRSRTLPLNHYYGVLQARGSPSPLTQIQGSTLKLSLCIVGCGGYARTVLEEIGDVAERFQLFFASRDLEKARSYSETYGGAGFFGSYEEAAGDDRVAALYFLTPHHVHLENAQLAARHRKHILVEKPIARTIKEAQEMIAAARNAGVRLMVAENWRFLAALDKCKELMAQGAIGDLRLIQIQAESYGKPTEWRADAKLNGGGWLIDGGIHFVDALISLGGYPERLYAAMPPPAFSGTQAEDGAVITVHLPGGALGLLNYSGATPVGGERRVFKVRGTKGQISFDAFGAEVTLETPDEQRTIRLQEGGRGVRGMMREFRSCVLEEREPVMSGEEGLRDLAIVLAAYRSAERSAEVSVTPP